MYLAVRITVDGYIPDIVSQDDEDRDCVVSDVLEKFTSDKHVVKFINGVFQVYELETGYLYTTKNLKYIIKIVTV